MFLIGKFFTGQTTITLLNVLAGFLFLRILPVDEYALYVVASAILTIVSLCSDMGLSQGVNSIGSRLLGRPVEQESLYRSALTQRKRLFLIVLFPALIVGSMMVHANEWLFISILICMVIVFVTGWIQLPINLRKSIFSVNRDIQSLFNVGLSEAMIRLVFLPICLIWPTAAAALLINLLGVGISVILVERKYKELLLSDTSKITNYRLQLRQFVIPLIPSVLYYAFQGQISTIILIWYGYTREIAEVGALSRLGQLASLFIVLCPVFIQPVFAKVTDKKHFLLLLQRVLILLTIFCSFSVLSSIVFPDLWLTLMGKNYASLTRELPVAMLGAMLNLTAAVIYTIIISRGSTKGQIWSAVISLLVQSGYIISHGVHNTFDALIVNVLPICGYLVIQILLLVRIVINWPITNDLEPDRIVL